MVAGSMKIVTAAEAPNASPKPPFTGKSFFITGCKVPIPQTAVKDNMKPASSTYNGLQSIMTVPATAMEERISGVLPVRSAIIMRVKVISARMADTPDPVNLP